MDSQLLDTDHHRETYYRFPSQMQCYYFLTYKGFKRREKNNFAFGQINGSKFNDND